MALQAVRGHIISTAVWPDSLHPDHKILANFLDLQITPWFLAANGDFTPFENRYTSKITEVTGFPSKTKNFQPAGKTFRDFAEHRLGTSLEGALFLCLRNFNTDGRAHIPSLAEDGNAEEQLKLQVTSGDAAGIARAMDLILNPMIETGSKIIQMNPPIQKEFPNLMVMAGSDLVGKTFKELVEEAVAAPAPVTA